MCIIKAQIDTIDKLSMQIITKTTYDKIWPDFLCPQWSRQVVIMVFRSIWMTTKINGVVTDLFCTGVIGHPRHVFLI